MMKKKLSILTLLVLIVLSFTAKAQVAYPIKWEVSSDSTYCTDSTGLYNAAQNIRLANTNAEKVRILLELDKHNAKENSILLSKNIDLENKIKNERFIGIGVVLLLTSIIIFK